MALGSWLARRESAAAHGARFERWESVQSAVGDVGWVDRAAAAGLPGIGRGVNLVSDVIGSLFPEAVKNLHDPGRPLLVLPRPPLLRDPDPLWHGQSTWLTAAVRDLMYDGNAFGWYADTDRLGYPVRMPLLPPSWVSWEPSQSGPGPVFVVRPPGGARFDVEPETMMHAAVDVDSGKRMGQGILHRYQNTLKLITVVERATYVLMRDGKPAGLISTDVDMTAEELGEVKQGFIRGVGADGIGALVRASFDKISWSASDLALIPAREYNLRLASDVTGVTPYLLGVPSESRVYSNMETEWSNFVRVTVQRFLSPLQDALTGCLPRGQDVRFNTDELQRPDSVSRWTNHERAVGMGAMTVEEVRQAERLGPLPGQEGAA